MSTWRPWRDFTYENLLSVYSEVLSSTAVNPPKLKPTSDYDLEIWNEHSLDFFLTRFMHPTINWALRCATQAFAWGNEVFYLGPGSWTGNADWSVVSRHPTSFLKVTCKVNTARRRHPSSVNRSSATCQDACRVRLLAARAPNNCIRVICRTRLPRNHGLQIRDAYYRRFTH